jgi:putative membrane protein insertion efficiency factor
MKETCNSPFRAAIDGIPKAGRLTAVAALRAYQLLLSPLLPPACRFHPTCSQYAAEAVGKHGVWRGGWLAIRRLGRCHPLNAGGYDPVP